MRQRQLDKVIAAAFSTNGIFTLLCSGVRGFSVRQFFPNSVSTFETDFKPTALRVFQKWLDNR